MAIRHLVLTIFLSMFIIISTGCDESINEDKIEINFAITGEKVLYDYDESFMNGVRMAIADCNLQYADLGYQVSMEFYDDESIFEKGMAIANSIARDNSVSAVLGSQSFYITDAAAEIFENAGKILITPFSANDETLEVGYQYLFRNTFSAYDVGVALARYAAKKNYKNIAVCIKGTEYEAAVIRGFYRESRDLGPKIVDYLTKARTQEELREVFTRWDLLSVDCVLIIQFHEDDAFALLKAIRAKKPAMPILGDMAFDIKELLHEYREFSDNIVIAGPLKIEPGDKNMAFKERYFKEFNVYPTDYSIQGYDSIRMVVDTAVKINSAEPVIIAAELHQNGYEGLSGVLRFDEKGRMLSGLPELFRSHDGAFGRISYE